MSLILYFVLGLAIVGTLSSAVFLGLTAIGVIRFHADARRQLRSVPDDAHLPAVSVLKPVHGLEAQLKENIESFFRQDYPDYEILFAADEADDAGARSGAGSLRSLSAHPHPHSGNGNAVAESGGLFIPLPGGGSGARNSGHHRQRR